MAIKSSRQFGWRDRKSTRLNSSHTEIYTLSLHDALPIFFVAAFSRDVLPDEFHRSGTVERVHGDQVFKTIRLERSEEHTSELQSHRDLHSFPTRRSSDLFRGRVFARCTAR